MKWTNGRKGLATSLSAWLVVMCLSLFGSRGVDAGTKKHHDHGKKQEDSEFVIDKSVLDDFYRGQITDVRVETRYRSGNWEISPQFSYANPSEFELKNGYFIVPYAANGASFPLLQVSLATPLGYWGGFEFFGEAKVGYGYREGVYQVTNSQSGEFRTDVITLHWLPVSGALRLAYRIPGVSFLKPFLHGGAGAQWLQQSGKLDGITQGFWVPFYAFGGGLSAFDQTESGDHWFGGVRLGATVSRSVGSSQVVRYWSLDAGITLLL